MSVLPRKIARRPSQDRHQRAHHHMPVRVLDRLEDLEHQVVVLVVLVVLLPNNQAVRDLEDPEESGHWDLDRSL
jgi:hypothetical protein